MNRTTFFDAIRARPFGGRLTQAQVNGILAILDGFEARHAHPDWRWLAAILATAFHETGARMQPVRETFAASDDEAIARLDLAFANGRLGQVKAPYWRRDAQGRAWFGRGLVQLTHKANYIRLGKAIGVDLVTRPDRALDRRVAVEILITGMERGLFTGVSLADCFGPGKTLWEESRAIVNGRDQAARIARIALAFHAALIAASTTEARSA